MGPHKLEKITNDYNQIISYLNRPSVSLKYLDNRFVQIEYLDTEGSDLAILKSKAVGEPPLMYGMGAYFAIDNAVRAFNPNFKSTYNAPFTHEKVLMGLYSK